jgi:hypothetical protein
VDAKIAMMMTLKEAQRELLRHNFDFFVSSPPSVAEGGADVVVPGCPACRKRLQTVNQFMAHLAEDVLPVILRAREPGEE